MRDSPLKEPQPKRKQQPDIGEAKKASNEKMANANSEQDVDSMWQRVMAQNVIWQAQMQTQLQAQIQKQTETMTEMVSKEFEKQAERFDSIGQQVERAVNDAVGELKATVSSHIVEIRELSKTTEKLQSGARALKRDVNNNTTDIDKLRSKLASLEDQDRRNNVRITGLTAGREGKDAAEFLKRMLPKWIPTLTDRVIPIERAHRIYSPRDDGQSTMIFKALRFQDREAILRGAREARKNGAIQDQGKVIRFYADFSAHTNEKRRAYADVMKELRERNIAAFLIYPAILKMNHRGTQRSFASPEEVRRFLDGERRGGSARRGLTEQLQSLPNAPSAPEEMDDS